MEVDAILCNHAETAENKLFLSGGGVNMTFVAPVPPHVVSIGIGHVIHVPYQLTNQAHELRVSMVDEDGHPVVPFTPEGMPQAPPVELVMPFNVGRPSLITQGDEQTLAVAANFINLPLPATGLFSFHVEIDGTKMRELPFRVTTPPPGFPVLSN